MFSAEQMIAMNWMLSDAAALQNLAAHADQHLAELQALADGHVRLFIAVAFVAFVSMIHASMLMYAA